MTRAQTIASAAALLALAFCGIGCRSQPPLENPFFPPATVPPPGTGEARTDAPLYGPGQSAAPASQSPYYPPATSTAPMNSAPLAAPPPANTYPPPAQNTYSPPPQYPAAGSYSAPPPAIAPPPASSAPSSNQYLPPGDSYNMRQGSLDSRSAANLAMNDAPRDRGKVTTAYRGPAPARGNRRQQPATPSAEEESAEDEEQLSPADEIALARAEEAAERRAAQVSYDEPIDDEDVPNAKRTQLRFVAPANYEEDAQDQPPAASSAPNSREPRRFMVPSGIADLPADPAAKQSPGQPKTRPTTTTTRRFLSRNLTSSDPSAKATGSTSGKTSAASATGSRTILASTPASRRGGDSNGVTPAADLASYGYDPNYAWVKGKLERSQVTGRWKLRYIPIDGETDRYGGSVLLDDNPLLVGMHPGDFVAVQGAMAAGQKSAGVYVPHYSVERLKRLEK